MNKNNHGLLHYKCLALKDAFYRGITLYLVLFFYSIGKQIQCMILDSLFGTKRSIFHKSLYLLKSVFYFLLNKKKDKDEWCT